MVMSSKDQRSTVTQPTQTDDRAPYLAQRIDGWGHADPSQCKVYRAHRMRDVARTLATGDAGTYIPRGSGRSYGDAAVNPGQGVIRQDPMDRILALDTEAGMVTCEAGVTLGNLLLVLAPRGLVPPVLPGTRHATVGGAIAADVHGKDHHLVGAMADHVHTFELLTADSQQLTCSREEHPEIFWATLGGMGLTGSILQATLDLERIGSTGLVLHRAKTDDLGQTLQVLRDSSADHRYAVAWLDLLASGDKQGRGVVTGADRASPPRAAQEGGRSLTLETPGTLQVPFTAPSWLLNRTTGTLFNGLYYHTRAEVQQGRVSMDRFSFQLDRLGHWYRLYGSRGLYQYQFVVPTASAEEALGQVVDRLDEAPVPVLLAVLKTMGPGDAGMLSFPMEGMTLALDVPATEEARTLFGALDRIVARYDGRVYLAKDATLSQESFEAMYPEADRFRELREELDPQARWSSSLSRRLGLDPGDRRGGLL